MQSFIISHSSCAEQYGDMSSNTLKHTHTHTIKPPTAGVQLVGHTSINYLLNVFVFIRIFSHFCVESMFWTRRHQAARSCASSPDNPSSVISCLMMSIHLRFCLPFFHFPYISMIITPLPTYSSFLLTTCPYQFTLLSCTFLDIFPILLSL